MADTRDWMGAAMTNFGDQEGVFNVVSKGPIVYVTNMVSYSEINEWQEPLYVIVCKQVAYSVSQSFLLLRYTFNVGFSQRLKIGWLYQSLQLSSSLRSK